MVFFCFRKKVFRSNFQVLNSWVKKTREKIVFFNNGQKFRWEVGPRIFYVSYQVSFKQNLTSQDFNFNIFMTIYELELNLSVRPNKRHNLTFNQVTFSCGFDGTKEIMLSTKDLSCLIIKFHTKSHLAFYELQFDIPQSNAIRWML